jgi:hypothetical protein
MCVVSLHSRYTRALTFENFRKGIPPPPAVTNTHAVTVSYYAVTGPHEMEACRNMGPFSTPPSSAGTCSSSSPCQEGGCNGGICAKVLYLLNLSSKHTRAQALCKKGECCTVTKEENVLHSGDVL